MRFKGLDRWFKGLDMRFGYNTYSSRALAPVQIVRHLSHILDKPPYAPYPPYHRYKGLSSRGGRGRYKGITLDIKHSIYKHYMVYMRDMGI